MEPLGRAVQRIKQHALVAARLDHRRHERIQRRLAGAARAARQRVRHELPAQRPQHRRAQPAIGAHAARVHHAARHAQAQLRQRQRRDDGARLKQVGVVAHLA